MNAQARLGAFVLIGLLLLGLATGRVGKMVWLKQETHIVEAVFDDLYGLELQASVRMAGVKVGIVQETVLREHRAVVRIALEPDVQLPASTTASIVSRGLVGEKYISLRAKRGDTEYLPDGAVIPSEAGGDINVFIARVTAVADDVRALSLALKDIVAGEEGVSSLKKLLENTNTTVLEFLAILKENRKDVRTTMIEMRRVTHQISLLVRKHRKQLEKFAKTLPKAVAASQEFFTQGKKTIKSVDAIVLDNRENLYRMLFELRKAAENLEVLSDELRRNPWKLVNKQPEVPPSPRAKQEKMEEMLLTTGQMGVAPARK